MWYEQKSGTRGAAECVTDVLTTFWRLFSNRSQMTSKCGMNKKVAHEAQPSVSLMFLPHFGVLCDLLLNRRTATWNLFVKYKQVNKLMTKYDKVDSFSSVAKKCVC